MKKINFLLCAFIIYPPLVNYGDRTTQIISRLIRLEKKKEAMMKRIAKSRKKIVKEHVMLNSSNSGLHRERLRLVFPLDDGFLGYF
jgi:hypothetical protein